MHGRIKILGVALVAALALAALGASAAQAAFVGVVTKGGATYEGTVELTGEQVEGNAVFTIDGSSIECNSGNTSATGKDGETRGKMHPTYEGCNAFGFIGATVATTGCNLEAMATEETSAGVFAGELNVVCETGKQIQINAGSGTCVASVGSQTITAGIKATNATAEGKMQVKLDGTQSPVATVKNQDGFGCPFNGTGATTGNMTAHITVKAYSGTPHNLENQLDGTISP
ncbi:MAG TPA: hypothetical protein VFI17_06115 [Solirubrobacterales bacterium]|nr:hypothetical protein [Solirubrobacterales bacterium]